MKILMLIWSELTLKYKYLFFFLSFFAYGKEEFKFFFDLILSIFRLLTALLRLQLLLNFLINSFHSSIFSVISLDWNVSINQLINEENILLTSQ